MKRRILMISITLIFGMVYALFCYKYVPHTQPFLSFIILLILLLIISTAISIRFGTLSIVFLVPLVNSLPYFFNLRGFNPLLFIFLGYLLGALIHRVIFPLPFKFVKPLSFPVIGAIFIIVISTLITLWRYSNFFPLFDDSIYELVINTINVKSGEAFRRVIFDSLNYLGGFLWFWIVVTVLHTQKLIKRAIILLATASVISLFFGFYQFLINPECGNLDYFVNIHRINALFSDPNAFGAYLTLSIPLFAGALLAFKKKWKLFFLMPLVGFMFLLPHIGSRSGFLGVVLAIIFFLCFMGRIIINYKRSKPELFRNSLICFLLFLLFIGIMSSFLIFSKGSKLYQRLKWNVEVMSKNRALERISQGREHLWPAAILMIKESPLSGIGIGSFMLELPNYYKKYDIFPIKPFPYYQSDAGSKNSGVLIDTAGNLYLQIGSELGIIGLFFLCWILVAILKKIYSTNFRQKFSSDSIFIIVGISSGILSMLFIFLFGAHTLNFEVQLTFWLMIGILYALAPTAKDEIKFIFPKRMLVIIFILFFASSHIWESTHSLSLRSRTETFGLIQEFGFYQEEEMDGQEFRWIKKNAGTTVRVKRSTLILPILASHPDINENPVKVKIFLTKNLFKDTKLLDEVVLSESNWCEFDYDLSDEVGTDILILFKTSRTWQPSKILGTADSRNLGIAVGKMRFEGTSVTDDEMLLAHSQLLFQFSRHDWQGPLGGNLIINGKSWITVQLPEGKIILNILAKGRKAKGEWPYMLIRLNDKIIGGDWVSSENWRAYLFQDKVKSGKFRVSVEFVNDYWNPQRHEDRNLFIGSLEVLCQK